VSALPLSAVLATWLDACRRGDVGPDDLEEAVRGDAPRHLVVGLPELPPLDLHQLPARVSGTVSLALPAPGDLVGLRGPAGLNTAALDAGEAVVVGELALVPEDDARTVVWRAHRAEPVPFVDERETGIVLRTTLADVTRRLVALDVASWQPEIPDLLMNLRHRAPLPLPPGMEPRRVETVDRALLCLEVAALARRDDGGAVSAYEMGRRREALGDLERAARHALVGACSARS
jgi:hypothetical protein